MIERVVLLHGFTQTGASWSPLRHAFAARHIEVVAPDLPGHGERADVRADLWASARLALADGGAAAYAGYSMGGRVALHAALLRPDLVDRLVLVGATAGIDDEAERDARAQADDDLAASIERDGVDAFLDRWLAGPLFASLDDEQAGLEHRSRDGAGLASSLRLAGTGTMTPLWDRLGEIKCPVLCVAGQRDSKFRDLAERMAAAWGGPAAVAVIDGAGHACHLEHPAAFLAAVLPFLADHESHSASE